MNINLKLTIPIVKEDGSSDVIKVDSNLLLAPYYCVEEDVLSIFPTYTDEDTVVLRKIIFNASLKADRVTQQIQLGKYMLSEDLIALRRDYTICLANNEFAKRLNSNLSKARSQSKTLGDFSVSTSTTGDNSVVLQIFKDSAQCILEVEKLIKDIEIAEILPSSFVKGQYNTSNIQANDRLWWLKDMGGFKVLDGYASNKFTFNGNKYKAGQMTSMYS